MNLFGQEPEDLATEIRTAEERTAEFSACGTYRYALTRVWNPGKPKVVFIGLNPSTANASLDDPTIRRCRGFAKSNDYGGLVMANLFAFRATDPKAMKAAADPVGPENDAWLRKLATEEYDTEIGRMSEGEPGESNLLIAAWGIHGGFQDRDKAVQRLLFAAGRDAPVPEDDQRNLHFNCLGVTKGGYPRHPLYVRADMDFCGYEVNL